MVAHNTTRCLDCKKMVYTALLSRGICPVCESGAQHLKNAMYHVAAEQNLDFIPEIRTSVDLAIIKIEDRIKEFFPHVYNS